MLVNINPYVKLTTRVYEFESDILGGCSAIATHHEQRFMNDEDAHTNVCIVPRFNKKSFLKKLKLSPGIGWKRSDNLALAKGAFNVQDFNNSVYISAIATNPKCQGLGLGHDLMEFCAMLAYEDGHDTIELAIANTPGYRARKRFFVGQGFTEKFHAYVTAPMNMYCRNTDKQRVLEVFHVKRGTVTGVYRVF